MLTFKTLVAPVAALTFAISGAFSTPVEAKSDYQVVCGETSSVLETADYSMQIHRGGDVTFFDRDASRSLQEIGGGTWTSSRDGDVRVTANATGKSHVFDGFFQAKCDRMF